MKANGLAKKRCKPCEGGTKPFSSKDALEMKAALHDDWHLGSDNKKISREFKFKNFLEAIAFVNKVGSLAETEGHHPDIVLKWAYAKIELWTHSIGGLSENDFILAAKIDEI